MFGGAGDATAAALQSAIPTRISACSMILVSLALRGRRLSPFFSLALALGASATAPALDALAPGSPWPDVELPAQQPPAEADEPDEAPAGTNLDIGAAGQAVVVATTVDGQYRHDLAPTATAIRIEGDVTVDGVLDEEVWSRALAITDFIQELPLEGDRGTQRTEVRIAYDDDAVYVGAVLYDTEPVTERLTRRDRGRGDHDWIQISLDSYHDHETAYHFGINPSGSFRDVVSGGGGGDGGFDDSWDPVWDRAARTTDSGWTAELRIPFSQLRFSPAEEQVWGIRVQRNIHAAQELAVFPFVPTLERGGASRFAHLEGIRDIQPGRRLELLPYATARGEYLHLDSPADVTFDNPYRSGSDHFGDVGMDLKYRLTSNVTLDATVNPDFGQVELDPSVINLTAFETRYQEQRPFFVEGADIFNFGEGGPGGSTGRGPQLLYSRRIGRSPQGSVPSEAAYADMASATTILGAAKVTGRTPDGWSVGFLEAVTAEETAPYVTEDRTVGESVVEPTTNYLVGRVRRQIRGGETRFGVIGSAVNRSLDASAPTLVSRLHSSAYTGGVDFAHEWSNRTYRISGIVTASHVTGSPEAILRTQRSSTRYYQRPDADHLELDPSAVSLSGYYAFVDAVKQAGAFGAKAALAFASPGYEVNDLGFQSASDRIIFDTNFSYNQPTPGRYLRSWNVRGSPDGVWNYAGDRVFSEINGNINLQFLNYWSTGMRLAYNPAHDDDRLTRGGPMAATPRQWQIQLNASSDSRRDLVGRLSWQGARDESGGWQSGVSLNLSANPSERIQLQLGPNVQRRFQTAQYVTSVQDPTATTTYGRRYVFAGLDQTTVSLDTRVNVTFTPDLSLQVYVEPFVSAGDYRGLREFERPGAFEFVDYGVERGTVEQQESGSYIVDPDGSGPAESFTVANRDFSYRSLLGNAVLRWEWRQGSTLYLVWQQRRISSLTNRGPDGTDSWVGEFDWGRDTGDLLSVRPDNIFAIKVNYWLNP